jgi:hypothetical protein
MTLARAGEWRVVILLGQLHEGVAMLTITVPSSWRPRTSRSVKDLFQSNKQTRLRGAAGLRGGGVLAGGILGCGSGERPRAEPFRDGWRLRS